jgi:predicted amino acid-binding ACT domain protein
MQKQRLYIVRGRGNDAVGLVGSITEPIGARGGNIIDLRQDVLHGLFTLHMVVDLSSTELRLEDLSRLCQEIGEDSGLDLAVERYLPVAQTGPKKHVRLILLGADRPGIIASVSKTLGAYRANIEAAQTIAREGLFLLELLTNVKDSRIPLENLMVAIERTMTEMGMQTLFQTDDVFNKKKHVILFDASQSLLDAAARCELVAQAGAEPGAVAAAYASNDLLANLRKAAALLEGIPADVVDTLLTGICPSSGTVELFETLRTMGYRIGLRCDALSPFAVDLAAKLGLEHCRSLPVAFDDDARTLVGEISAQDFEQSRLPRAMAEVATAERIAPSDVTVVSDRELAALPGLRVDLDLTLWLHLLRERVVSQSQLIGLLGSFGSLAETP